MQVLVHVSTYQGSILDTGFLSHSHFFHSKHAELSQKTGARTPGFLKKDANFQRNMSILPSWPG